MVQRMVQPLNCCHLYLQATEELRRTRKRNPQVLDSDDEDHFYSVSERGDEGDGQEPDHEQEEEQDPDDSTSSIQECTPPLNETVIANPVSHCQIYQDFICLQRVNGIRSTIILTLFSGIPRTQPQRVP